MTGWLWYLIALGTVALGVGIAYGFIVSRRRSQDHSAQRRSDAATDRLYRLEDERDRSN